MLTKRKEWKRKVFKRKEAVDGFMSQRSQERERTKNTASSPSSMPSIGVSPGTVEGIHTTKGVWAMWLRSLHTNSVTTVSIHPYCTMWPISWWCQIMWETSLKYSLVPAAFPDLPETDKRGNESFETNSTCPGMWPSEKEQHSRKSTRLGVRSLDLVSPCNSVYALQHIPSLWVSVFLKIIGVQDRWQFYFHMLWPLSVKKELALVSSVLGSFTLNVVTVVQEAKMRVEQLSPESVAVSLQSSP